MLSFLSEEKETTHTHQFFISQRRNKKHPFAVKQSKKWIIFAFSTIKKSGDKEKTIFIFEKNQKKALHFIKTPYICTPIFDIFSIVKSNNGPFV